MSVDIQPDMSSVLLRDLIVSEASDVQKTTSYETNGVPINVCGGKNVKSYSSE